MELLFARRGGSPSNRNNTQETSTNMANTLLPLEERNLTPEQVELLDKRRRRGQLFLVICFQFVGTLVTLWSGQDWTLSPGWAHPMVYWNAAAYILALVFGVAGVRLRRG